MATEIIIDDKGNTTIKKIIDKIKSKKKKEAKKKNLDYSKEYENLGKGFENFYD